MCVCVCDLNKERGLGRDWGGGGGGGGCHIDDVGHAPLCFKVYNNSLKQIGSMADVSTGSLFDSYNL